MATDDRLMELIGGAVNDDGRIDAERIAMILGREKIIPMRGQLSDVLAAIRLRRSPVAERGGGDVAVIGSSRPQA